MASRRYITSMPFMRAVCSMVSGWHYLLHGLQDSNYHHGAGAQVESELLDLLARILECNRSVLYRSAADSKAAADNSAVERPVADSQLRLLLSHCSTGRLLR